MSSRIERHALFTAALLATMATPALAGGDEAGILKQHFDATGGLDRLSAIETVKRSGTATLTGPFGQLSGTIEEAAVVGQKSYSHMDVGVHVETTAWDGATAWKTTPMEGTVELTGNDMEVARSAAFLDALQPVFEQYGAAAFERLEDETVDGVDCIALGLVDTEIIFYLDQATHLHVATKSGIEDPGLGKTFVLLRFSDHAEHGGVMLPDRP